MFAKIAYSGQKKARTFVNKISYNTVLGTLKLGEKLKSEEVIDYLEHRFITPKSYTRSPLELKTLQQADREEIQVDQDKITVWTWGQGPKILLIHGWSGRGGQFHPWVKELVNQGFQVITFDAPGHGYSEGKTSAFPTFINSIEALADKKGAFHALIGHSLGGAAAILSASRGVSTNKLVSLAAPGDIQALFSRTFQNKMGFKPRVTEGVKHRLAQRYQVSMNDLEPLLHSPKLKQELLLWHDLDDKEVPWSEAEQLFRQSPRAKLKTIKGSGHYRILRNQEVIQDSLAFLLGNESLQPESPHMELLLGKANYL